MGLTFGRLWAARCPICRMPCAMSELRPAEFDGEEEAAEVKSDPEGGGSAAGEELGKKKAAVSAGGWMADGEDDGEDGGEAGSSSEVDEWAAAEAAWAAAEAEADALDP